MNHGEEPASTDPDSQQNIHWRHWLRGIKLTWTNVFVDVQRCPDRPRPEERQSDPNGVDDHTATRSRNRRDHQRSPGHRGNSRTRREPQSELMTHTISSSVLFSHCHKLSWTVRFMILGQLSKEITLIEEELRSSCRTFRKILCVLSEFIRSRSHLPKSQSALVTGHVYWNGPVRYVKLNSVTLISTRMWLNIQEFTRALCWSFNL